MKPMGAFHFQAKNFIPTTLTSLFGLRLESEPSYKVITRCETIELRFVDPYVELSTLCGADDEDARSEAFDRLFSYVEGNNKERRISDLAAPIWEERGEGQLRTSIYLADVEQVDSAPRPVDPRLRLQKQSSHFIVAKKFSGATDQASIQKAIAELVGWSAKNFLAPVGQPRVAFFDPPLTIPQLRRNEIQIVCETPSRLIRRG